MKIHSATEGTQSTNFPLHCLAECIPQVLKKENHVNSIPWKRTWDIVQKLNTCQQQC